MVFNKDRKEVKNRVNELKSEIHSKVAELEKYLNEQKITDFTLYPIPDSDISFDFRGTYIFNKDEIDTIAQVREDIDYDAYSSYECQNYKFIDEDNIEIGYANGSWTSSYE